LKIAMSYSGGTGFFKNPPYSFLTALSGHDYLIFQNSLYLLDLFFCHLTGEC
jgi:hypothetical protein